jgi:hypothetical protein
VSGALSLTQAGTYEIVYAPNTAGPATFSVQQLPAPATASISANGQQVPVSTTVPYQGIQMSFSGTAGEVVSLLVSEPCASGASTASFCDNASSSLTTTSQAVTVTTGAEGVGTTTVYTSVSPTTGWLTNGNLNTSNAEQFWSRAFTLPSTGIYTITLVVAAPNTGTANFTLSTATPLTQNVTSSQYGTSIPVTTTAYGQSANLSFSGNAGQTFSVLITENCASALSYSVLCGGGSNTPQDITISPSVTTTSTDSSDFSGAYFGSVYGDLNTSSTEGFWSGAFTLPATGTYTLALMNYWPYVGTYNVTLSQITEIPVQVTSGQYGTPIPFTISQNGQSAILTFTASQNDVFSLLATENCANVLSNSAFCGQIPYADTPQQVVITTPNSNGTIDTVWYASSVYGNQNTSTTEGFWSGSVTLPSTGTYTISLTDYWSNIGTASFTLSKISGDSVGAPHASYGATVPMRVANPGQPAVLSLDGTVGDIFTMRSVQQCDAQALAGLACSASALPPAIAVQAEGSAAAASTIWQSGPGASNLTIASNGELETGAIQLPASGNYTISQLPSGPFVGTSNVTLTKVTQPPAQAVENGPAVSVKITGPGQSAVLAFAGVAGDTVDLSVSEPCAVSLVASSLCGGGNATPQSLVVTAPGVAAATPIWSTMSSGDSNSRSTESFSTGNLSLPATGNYLVTLTDLGPNIGSAAVMVSKSTNPVAVQPNGVPVNVTTGSVGRDSVVSLSAAANESVSVLITESCSTNGNALCSVDDEKPQIVTITAAGASGAANVVWSGTGSSTTDRGTSTKSIWTGAIQLPGAGSYAIHLANDSTRKGTASFTVFADNPAIVTQEVQLGGLPHEISTIAPGQSAGVSFLAKPGQIIDLGVDTVSRSSKDNCYTVNIMAATKSTPIWQSLACRPNFATGRLQLPSDIGSGVVTAVVTPTDTSIGTFRFKLGIF